MKQRVARALTKVCVTADFEIIRRINPSHNDTTEIRVACHRATGKRVVQKLVRLSSEKNVIRFMREVWLGIVCESPVTMTPVWFGLEQVVNPEKGSKDTYGIIATEFYENGSVWEFFNERNGCVTNTEKTTMAFDVYASMWLLEQLKVRHRDCKPMNYLVGPNHDVRLCDFGHAKVDNDALNSCNYATTVFAAPEGKNFRESPYGYKADVYSNCYVFGVIAGFIQTVHAITTRRWQEPLQRPLGNDFFQMSDDQLSQRQREFVEQCWSRDPRMRPSFSMIVDEFDSQEMWFPGSDPGTVKTHIANRKKQLGMLVAELRDGSSTTVLLAQLLACKRPWFEVMDMLGGSYTTEEKRLLALMMHHGVIFDRDDVVALQLDSDLPHPTTQRESQYFEACKAQVEGRTQDAIAIFTEGAKRGDIICLTQLGILLLSSPVESDQRKGERLLAIAAQKEDKKAAFHYGIHLWKMGNLELARHYLAVARGLGHPLARYAIPVIDFQANFERNSL